MVEGIGKVNSSSQVCQIYIQLQPQDMKIQDKLLLKEYQRQIVQIHGLKP